LQKLVIFGVGLIGGSIALALKKAGNAPHIVGIGRNASQLDLAIELGAIDATSDASEANIHAVCSDADLIIIATPVAQTEKILTLIKPHIGAHTAITDAGSTKSNVVLAARNALGDRFSQFVPGHPIAGAEKSGVTAANADLFIGKNVILTAEVETNQDALSRVTAMWQACGAKVSRMNAAEHDAVFAAVSHLPHLLAFALVDEIAHRPNAQQLFSFAASGFRDFTRIAGSSPEMWRDIALANRDSLLNELDAYAQQIATLRSLLSQQDAAGLQAMFEHASKARNDWGKTQ
jgi:prephenate dehydrogenase